MVGSAPEKSPLAKMAPAVSFIALYRNGPDMNPCAGETTVQKYGSPKWRVSVSEEGQETSGALVMKSVRAFFVRRWLDVVVVGTMSFRFSGMEGQMFLFKDAEGDAVRGRIFGDGGGGVGADLLNMIVENPTSLNGTNLLE